MICKSCKIEKIAEDFAPTRRECKSCRNLYFKTHYSKNSENKIKQVVSYGRKRLKTDSSYRLKQNLKRRLNLAINGLDKASSTMNLIGCSIEQLKNHLESQFKPDMSWDNYGFYGWHIDHKIPCASFDLTDPVQQAICFNYKNLQPLWATENISKGKRYEKESIHRN